MVFLVSGGMSEGARPFPLKIFDTKIQSTQPLENASIVILETTALMRIIGF